MAKAAKTRTCVACRNEFDKSELLRFVVDPSNNLMLDVYAKAPARGSYVCSDDACLSKAIDKQVLIKMLKANKDENFKSSVLKSLLAKISTDLKMLKKAQLFAPGAEQTLELIKANKADFVLFVEDISEKSQAKILSSLEKNSVEHATVLTKDELSNFVDIANCSLLAFKRNKLTTSLKNTLKVYGKLR